MLKESSRGIPFLCLFFTFSLLWLEIVMMLFTEGDINLNIKLLFSASIGVFIACAVSIFPFKLVRRVLTIVISAALAILFFSEILLWRSFGYFYPIETIFNMASDVADGFSGNVLGAVKNELFTLFLLSLPTLIFVFISKNAKLKARSFFGLALTLAIGILIHFSAENAIKNLSASDEEFVTDLDYYGEKFDFDQGVSRFGLATALRLNSLYSALGLPKSSGFSDISYIFEKNTPELQLSDFSLSELCENENDFNIKNLAAEFLTVSPTEKNEYTGIFKGKNLIFICAEALSPYAVSAERTPTLYSLMNEGFVFANYYQPSFGESTSGGEYALLCSQVPGHFSGEKGLSMALACDENLKYSLPGLFSLNGYNCSGFHNNSYTYYSRNITHPKMGLNWYGVGGCVTDSKEKIDLGERLSPGWPRSDEELVMFTSDIYMSSEKPFFTYYLTVSGHNNYSFSENTQARKNRLSADEMIYSERVEAYLACQTELEKALTKLISELKEANILDETVIALSNDHYPYGLSAAWQGNNGRDYTSELAGKKLDQYERERGVFFIWNSEMKHSVSVTKPTSGFDVMPTLLNLFGIEYDSRLLAGRDAMSSSDGLVFFSDFSFISEKGSYFAGKTAADAALSDTAEAVEQRIKNSRKLRKYDFFKYLEVYS